MTTHRREFAHDELPEELSARWTLHSATLLDSFRARIGRELLERSGDPADDAKRLFLAPFVVISHGVEPDPILKYGNRAALRLWEIAAPTLITTPSRMTAEPMLREARERLLEETARNGFTTGYEGVRIDAMGRRFHIHDVTIWNVTDSSGRASGQAATFARWTKLPLAE